jgi:hypothetical protein
MRLMASGGLVDLDDVTYYLAQLTPAEEKTRASSCLRQGRPRGALVKLPFDEEM